MPIPEKLYTINDSKLIIKIGDLVSSTAEVIVSSDDSDCSMGGGVSRAILSHGGWEIKEDAHKKTPAEIGDVVVGSAGRLPQKYIFHCISRKRFSGHSDPGLQEFIIQRTIEKCLKLIPILGIQSIAFPIIGTGYAAFDSANVLSMMGERLTRFLSATNKPYQIEVYIFDGGHNTETESLELCRAIEKTLAQIASETAEEENPSEQLDSSVPSMAVTSPNEKHDVFISYSRKDMATVMQFCREMDNMGIPYWLDVTDEHTGNNFKEVIVDAIDNSQIVVFMSSVNSNQSPFVVKEIGLAVSAQKHIVPIRIDDTPYAKSIRFDLSDIDWIDYRAEHSVKVMQKFRYCLQMFLK